MSHIRQLPLPFDHAPHYGAVDFLAAASNAAAQAWLADSARWPQHRLVLWGPAGSGKTHLLDIWARRQDARLLAGPGLRFVPPDRAIALDDADAAPERTLLHLLNAALEAGLPVLLAARTPPTHWATVLPDLASRLRATTAVEIHPAEDSLLRALLARLLAERQIAVSEAVQEWLLLRLPRTPAAMREAASRLDHQSLAAGRAVTRPLAAAVLADILEADETEDFTHTSHPAESAAMRLL